jgi:16S rRNA (guanine1207-N2)-methyltransferase
MNAPRLALAVDAGLIDSRHGRVVAFRPPSGEALAPLDPARTVVVHGARTVHDRLEAEGWEVVLAASGRFDAAIVFLPRERTLARDLVAEAAALTDGTILLDGAKADGIEAMLREVRSRAQVGAVMSKAHGKIFAATDGDFADWRAAPATIGTFRVAPGLFSADAPDPGSVALAAALPPLRGAVADLGAGWGYLSARVLASDAVSRLHAVEVEHAGAECLRANFADPRVEVHWADATQWSPPHPLDAVVMNPPFHDGRRPDPTLGRAFVTAAGRILSRRGELWMVANRHLPYEDDLRRAFAEIREIEGDTAYKVIHARGPTHPMR